MATPFILMLQTVESLNRSAFRRNTSGRPVFKKIMVTIKSLNLVWVVMVMWNLLKIQKIG